MTQYRLVTGVPDHILILQVYTNQWRTVPIAHFKDLDAGERKEIIKALAPVQKYLRP